MCGTHHKGVKTHKRLPRFSQPAEPAGPLKSQASMRRSAVLGLIGRLSSKDAEERDLRSVERKITAVWAAIRAAAQRREWPPSPSRLCDWCSFKEGCPAHGGEVPPAPIVEFSPVPEAR